MREIRIRKDCYYCEGAGTDPAGHKCSACNGKGTIKEWVDLDKLVDKITEEATIAVQKAWNNRRKA